MTCTTGNCCDTGCPCPSGLFVRDEFDCCKCSLDGDTGCADIDPASPHRAWSNDLDDKPCECECNPEAAGQEGSWTYTLDEEGRQISRSWEGECPEDKPTMDADTCSCICEKSIEDCAPKVFISNKCDCECQKTDDDCAAPNPQLDPDTCECGPCTLTCDDPALPDLDEDECECKCDKDDPNGGSTCSGSTPDLKASDCSCYCALAEKDPPICGQGEEFDSATCSCVPCTLSCSGCKEPNEDCSACIGCENCGDIELELAGGGTICCPDGHVLCDDACVNAECPVGQRYDYSVCSCVCDGDGKVICDGKCYDPCGAGESFDDNCDCYASASSLDVDLLP